VTLFCFVYFMSFAALTAALAATGLDFTTSLTGAAQALGNVGPGLGEVIGPAGNFKSIPDAAKWLSVAGMILGRLEFMAVLVLFTRRFWRG
jgi:trk system potassium uptake protein TrkH